MQKVNYIRNFLIIYHRIVVNLNKEIKILKDANGNKGGEEALMIKLKLVEKEL